MFSFVNTLFNSFYNNNKYLYKLFTNIEYDLLIAFFKDCLDKKKLQRVKDVTYDKATKEIKDIPPLTYNEETKTFSLKIDKNRIHTLKSLPPSKNATMKNKLI